ncbi:hypothetical protein [Actinoallomurus acaciae]|uniref:Uncharacterized protein n=1 Tax=Actinoallomurus acaciae TaxID=502577 RepID=A0ABV5YEE4_9ACTN
MQGFFRESAESLRGFGNLAGGHEFAFAGAGGGTRFSGEMRQWAKDAGRKDDGIARMGRRNNRGNSGGGRGGGGRGRGGRDGTGKFHGAIPNSTSGMTDAEKKKLENDLKKSIATRKAEEERLGWESGHAERIKREESALRNLFRRK